MKDIDIILPLTKEERKLLEAAMVEAIDYWGQVVQDEGVPMRRGMTRKKLEAQRLASYALYRRIKNFPRLKR